MKRKKYFYAVSVVVLGVAAGIWYFAYRAKQNFILKSCRQDLPANLLMTNEGLQQIAQREQNVEFLVRDQNGIFIVTKDKISVHTDSMYDSKLKMDELLKLEMRCVSGTTNHGFVVAKPAIDTENRVVTAIFRKMD